MRLHVLLIVLAFQLGRLYADDIENVWFTPLKEIRSNDLFFLAQLRGRLIILVFSASWNEPSKPLLLDLDRISKLCKRKKQRIAIISVVMEKDSRQMLLWVEQNRIEYPSYLIKEKDFEALGQKAVPAVFLFNKDGELIWRTAGYRNSFFRDITNEIEQEFGQN
ncbi:MAG: TlpA family protein disulfide reductase [Candidatus Coatesbacteria bacterium]|nr:TlpA family protein disulfide reductase [Candidatus Coatesbacteria bacterium]